MKRTPDQQLINLLRTLPATTWIKRKSWRRWLRLSERKPVRASGKNHTQLSQQDLIDLSVAEWPDAPQWSLRRGGGSWEWMVPPWFHFAPMSGTRMAWLNGAPLFAPGRMVSAVDQVPGLVGVMRFGGSWADDSAPVWLPVSQAAAEAGSVFPPLSEENPDGPVLLRWLSPPSEDRVVTVLQPLTYASLW